jgi:hypothetical protein
MRQLIPLYMFVFFGCHSVKISNLPEYYLFDGEKLVISLIDLQGTDMVKLNANGDSLIKKVTYVNCKGLDSICTLNYLANTIAVKNVLKHSDESRIIEEYDLEYNAFKKRYIQYTEVYDEWGNLVELCKANSDCLKRIITEKEGNYTLDDKDIGVNYTYFYSRKLSIDSIKILSNANKAVIKFNFNGEKLLKLITKEFIGKGIVQTYSMKYRDNQLTSVVFNSGSKLITYNINYYNTYTILSQIQSDEIIELTILSSSSLGRATPSGSPAGDSEDK